MQPPNRVKRIIELNLCYSFEMIVLDKSITAETKHHRMLKKRKA